MSPSSIDPFATQLGNGRSLRQAAVSNGAS
jgi:hypothetical protein